MNPTGFDAGPPAKRPCPSPLCPPVCGGRARLTRCRTLYARAPGLFHEPYDPEPRQNRPPFVKSAPLEEKPTLPGALPLVRGPARWPCSLALLAAIATARRAQAWPMIPFAWSVPLVRALGPCPWSVPLVRAGQLPGALPAGHGPVPCQLSLPVVLGVPVLGVPVLGVPASCTLSLSLSAVRCPLYAVRGLQLRCRNTLPKSSPVGLARGGGGRDPRSSSIRFCVIGAGGYRAHTNCAADAGADHAHTHDSCATHAAGVGITHHA